MPNVRKLMAAGAVAATVAVTGGVANSADLVQTAADAGSFQTLLAAAEAAGVVGLLQGEGPYTVFAPTDDAFAALGSTVDELLLPENRLQLREILLYHVLPQRVDSSAVLGGQQLEVLTFAYEFLEVKTTRGGVEVDSANVITADIETDNGVIHVIDSVLIP